MTVHFPEDIIYNRVEFIARKSYEIMERKIDQQFNQYQQN
jgi:hypothetical protein